MNNKKVKKLDRYTVKTSHRMWKSKRKWVYGAALFLSTGSAMLLSGQADAASVDTVQPDAQIPSEDTSAVAVSNDTVTAEGEQVNNDTTQAEATPKTTNDTEASDVTISQGTATDTSPTSGSAAATTTVALSEEPKNDDYQEAEVTTKVSVQHEDGSNADDVLDVTVTPNEGKLTNANTFPKNYEVVSGDVSGDGVLDTLDLSRMSTLINNPSAANESEKFVADINHDGTIDKADMQQFTDSFNKDNKPSTDMPIQKLVDDYPSKEILVGDLNQDDQVDATDLSMLVSRVKSQTNGSALENILADINRDGKINREDLKELSQDMEQSSSRYFDIPLNRLNTKEEQTVYLGDVTEDGIVDGLDITTFLQQLKSQAAPVGLSGFLADVNQDGQFSQGDLDLLIQQISADELTSFSAAEIADKFPNVLQQKFEITTALKEDSSLKEGESVTAKVEFYINGLLQEDATQSFLYTKPETQKVNIVFLDDTAGAWVATDNIAGQNGTSSEYTTLTTLAKLVAKGYELVSDGTKGLPISFDTSAGDKSYTVHVQQKTYEVTVESENLPANFYRSQLERTITETIRYHKASGEQVAAPVNRTVTFTRSAILSQVDNHVIGYTDWVANNDEAVFAEALSPEVTGFAADLPTVGTQKVTADSKNLAFTVTYQPVQTVPTSEKTETATPAIVSTKIPATAKDFSYYVANKSQTVEKAKTNKAANKSYPKTGESSSIALSLLGGLLASSALLGTRRKKHRHEN